MYKNALMTMFLVFSFPVLCSASKCLEGNCVDGYGKMIFKGYEYEGQWKNKKPNGKGRLKTPTGNIITGNGWIDGRLQGEGEEVYPSGRKYVGEFKDTKYHGQGTDTYPDGRVYCGEFANGIPGGKGQMTDPEGSVYEGDVVNGVPEGIGKMVFPNGFVYQGEFNQGEPNGKGEYTYNDGSRYVGEVKNGAPHGYGEFFGKDGEKLYSGRWMNGEELRQ